MAIPTPVPPSDEVKSALVERIIRGELTPEQAQQRHGLTRSELKDWVRVYRREARRAFDDRVKTVLSTQGIDIGELAAAEFSGNVEDMSVAELLQTIQLGDKDAEIRIELDRQLSHIWCIGGHVVDAESAELRGAAAIYRLLSLERGRVHADFAPVQRQRRIQVSTQALLMEGARRFDECRLLRARLGDLRAVFVPSDRSLAPNVQATPEQFAVLRLFDGFRTLEEVVQHSAIADLETLSCILQLRDSGLLERVRPSRTSLRELAAPESETVEASFLPLAHSLAGQPEPLPRPPKRRRWVWAVAAIGSSTLGAGIALRFADAETTRQRSSTAAQPSAPAALPALASAATGSAPPGASRLGHATGERASVERALTQPASRAAASLICPDGTVMLGSAPSDPTTPRASVASFCMARTEVTVAEYDACRGRGACDAVARDGDLPEARLSPALRQHAERVYSSQCNAGQPGRERHPINCVTHRQASAYCAAAGGRLPTEAEWELAARGSEGRPFPWGDAEPGPTRLNACGTECQAWYGAAQLDSVFDGVMYDGDDGFAGTAPVGSFPSGASRDGIYDLLGNVAEWTDTSVNFGQAQSEAPSAGTYVVRGGSFASGLDAESAPVLRIYLGADAHGRGVGFRCVYAPR